MVFQAPFLCFIFYCLEAYHLLVPLCLVSQIMVFLFFNLSVFFILDFALVSAYLLGDGVFSLAIQALVLLHNASFIKIMLFSSRVIPFSFSFPHDPSSSFILSPFFFPQTLSFLIQSTPGMACHFFEDDYSFLQHSSHPYRILYFYVFILFQVLGLCLLPFGLVGVLSYPFSLICSLYLLLDDQVLAYHFLAYLLQLLYPFLDVVVVLQYLKLLLHYFLLLVFWGVLCFIFVYFQLHLSFPLLLLAYSLCWFQILQGQAQDDHFLDDSQVDIFLLYLEVELGEARCQLQLFRCFFQLFRRRQLRVGKRSLKTLSLSPNYKIIIDYYPSNRGLINLNLLSKFKQIQIRKSCLQSSFNNNLCKSVVQILILEV